MSARAPLPRVVATALVALLAAACGTTVQQGPTTASGVAGESLSTVTSGQPNGTLPAASAAGGGGGYATPNGSLAATPGQGTSVGTGGSTSAATGSNTSTATNAGGEFGPGVTATQITIGVAYFQNANEANAAMGGKGIGLSDPTPTARAIVADVNRHGGIGGRRVVPLFFGVDPQSSTPYATEAQAECSYFTEDHKVFAVIDGTQGVGSIARACLQSHGVAFLTDNSAVVSNVYADEIDPDSILWSRLFASLVPSLVRQHWFAAWNRTTGTPGGTAVKTGIVTADRPDLNRAVDGILIPLLRRAGHAPDKTDVIRIAPPSGFTDDGATVAAIDNAALKLNSDGVDHVILTDANGSISLLFNNYAYSQHYFPRYGGSSGNFWQTLLAAGDIQAQTLHGALGIGFAPVLDVPFTGGRGPWPNATRDRCLSVMRAAGLAPSSASVEASQLTVCDAFFLLERTLRAATAINLDLLLRRASVLGDAFQPALALGDTFGRGQQDGIGRGVDFAFDSGCACFHYVGPTRRLPGPQT